MKPAPYVRLVVAQVIKNGYPIFMIDFGLQFTSLDHSCQS